MKITEKKIVYKGQNVENRQVPFSTLLSTLSDNLSSTSVFKLRRVLCQLLEKC